MTIKFLHVLCRNPAQVFEKGENDNLKKFVMPKWVCTEGKVGVGGKYDQNTFKT